MYKEYNVKPKTVKAEQFVEGMENGWRVYYKDPTDTFFGHWKDFDTKEECDSYVKSHSEFTFEEPTPLLILKDEEDEFEMDFGDYILSDGLIMDKEEFESQYEVN